MKPAELAARYRGYAVRCLLFVKHHDNTSDKLVLTDMAQAWATLADYIEKNESAFASFEVSDPEGHH
jgi:hypothetical protein